MPVPQHTSTLTLGVDVGGTKIAAGRVNDRAELLDNSRTTDSRDAAKSAELHLRCEPRPTACALVSKSVRATRAEEGFEASLNEIYLAIENELQPAVQAVGICAPGPLNPKTGVVLNPPNLPGWRNIPLAEMVQKRFGLPCRLENDANAAALAETRYGAARGRDSVFYATLGTGIGAGIVFNGKIYHGRNGAAAEGGHVTIDYRSDAICNCGVPGCIEALASGTAIARRGGTYDLDEMATMLGAWLGSIVSLLDPDIIVIGGGISQIGDPLFERLRKVVPARTINQFACEIPIVPAHFGQDCGIIGAATVALTA